jgi:hypothetical protein
VGTRSTLWKGKDHLLSITYTYGTERYKRFYYKDIQAFVTRKTVSGKIQNIAMGAMAVFFGVLAYGIDAPEGLWIFGILSALMALLLLVNVILGPTCECRIQTAVQKEKLKSLHRWKTAVKALKMILPLIHVAQGGLSVQELQSGRHTLPVGGADAASPETVLPAERRQGKIHTVLFGVLLILGLVIAFKFYQQHLAVVILEMILGLGTAVLVILALVRQHQSVAAGSLRIMAWISLGYMGVYLLGVYLIFMFVTFRHPAIAYDQWQLLKIFGGMPPDGHPLLFGINLFAAFGLYYWAWRPFSREALPIDLDRCRYRLSSLCQHRSALQPPLPRMRSFFLQRMHHEHGAASVHGLPVKNVSTGSENRPRWAVLLQTLQWALGVWLLWFFFTRWPGAFANSRFFS